MKERKFLKVKLTDLNNLNVEFTEVTDDEGASDKVSREGSHVAHPDLVQLFEEARIHAATLCEQGSYTGYEDSPEDLEIFAVTGITIGGEGEHEGVTIIARRTLTDEKVLNLIAPFTKFDPNHSNYSYVKSLKALIDRILIEADAYLEGKFAPSNQLSLFDAPEGDEESEDEGDGEEEAAPARKRRSKKTSMKVAS